MPTGPGQKGPVLGPSESGPSSYRAVQDRAAKAHTELFEKEFASKRIEEIKGERLKKIESLREADNPKFENVSSNISTRLFKDPVPGVNVLNPLNLGARRMFAVNRLFSNQNPNKEPVLLASSQEQVEAPEQEVSYDELFTNKEFIVLYDAFDSLDTLGTRDADQQAQYEKVKQILNDTLAKQNPPLSVDSSEFIQFRAKRKQDKFNDSTNDLLNDPKFLDLSKKLEDLYAKKELTADEQKTLVGVEKDLSEYLATHGLKFDSNAFKEFFKEKKRDAIYQEIAKLKDSDPELYNWAYAQLDTIDAALKKGTITQEEAESLSNEILEKVIKASSDKKLKKMWTDYTEKQETSFVTPTVSGAIDAAKPYFDGTGLVLSSSGFGDGCTVETTDSTNFSCEIIVNKDPNTNEFSYSIEDPIYANNGSEGPFTATELAEAVDSRRMDVFLTRKLRESGVDKAGDINKVPDKKIIDICKDLVGKGSDRGFRLEGEDLTVINGLVETLKMDDPEYSSINMKVEKLYLFLNKPERIDFVRRSYLKGEKLLASEIVNRGDAELKNGKDEPDESKEDKKV